MSRRIPAPVRVATRLALAWAAWYTRDLDPATTRDRRDEIASDVWEQVAGQADRPAAALAASIAGRVVRGIPADLAWRWRMPSLHPAPTAVRGAVAVAVVLSGATLALGIAALVRVAVGLARGEALPSVTTVASAAIGVTALVAGLALLARIRTRRLGLLWLGGAAGVTLHFSFLILVTLSTTFQEPYYRLITLSGQTWLPAWFAIVGAVAAVPALAALGLASAARSIR